MSTHDDFDDIDLSPTAAHAYTSVPAAAADRRDADIARALDEFGAVAVRSRPRIFSVAAAAVVVFGVGAVSGWVVRNNNTPAVAQPSTRTIATPEIPCHQLFPSINFVGYATPLAGEAAIFLDSRSSPEAIVLVSPDTCAVIARYELSEPTATG